MYGTQMFGQLTCALAVAIASPVLNGGSGYGINEFGQYLGLDNKNIVVVVPPIPPIPHAPIGGGRRKQTPAKHQVREWTHPAQTSKFIFPSAPVESSNIKDFVYDRTSKTLQVDFNSGGRYNYSGVPEKLVKKFDHAESKGSFHNAKIKDKFSFVKKR